METRGGGPYMVNEDCPFIKQEIIECQYMDSSFPSWARREDTLNSPQSGDRLQNDQQLYTVKSEPGINLDSFIQCECGRLIDLLQYIDTLHAPVSSPVIGLPVPGGLPGTEKSYWRNNLHDAETQTNSQGDPVNIGASKSSDFFIPCVSESSSSTTQGDLKQILTTPVELQEENKAKEGPDIKQTEVDGSSHHKASGQDTPKAPSTLPSKVSTRYRTKSSTINCATVSGEDRTRASTRDRIKVSTRDPPTATTKDHTKPSTRDRTKASTRDRSKAAGNLGATDTNLVTMCDNKKARKSVYALRYLNKRKLPHSNRDPDKKTALKCSDCDEVLKPTSIVKSPSQKSPKKCVSCRKRGVSSEDIDNKQKCCKKEIEHVCDVGHKVTKTKFALKYHMLSHTGERPHSCSVCGKAFGRKCHLNRHQLIHQGRKRMLTCPTCSRRYLSKDALKRHEKQHTIADPFKCFVCGSLFTRLDHFHVHKKKVHGIIQTTEYICGVCRKQFNRRVQLARHISVHETGAKPHQCTVCYKRFSRKYHLDRHQQIHIS